MSHHAPTATVPAGRRPVAAYASVPDADDRPFHPASNASPGGEPSPLDAVRSAFTALTTGPDPLAVDGAELGAGLPARRIGLDELQVLLLHPATSYEARDLVWAHIVAKARAGEAARVIGAVGLGLPGLRRIAARLATRMPRHQVPDLESEMLTGYLTALKGLEVTTGRIASRLCWAAYRAADRYRTSDPARSGVVTPMAGSMPPPRPWGHPDFVLARAVTDGILSDYEAELIARTRLEHLTLNSLAAAWGLPVSTLADDRARAEDRLVEVLDPTRHSRPAEVTDRSRSETSPEISPRNSDSEDESPAPAAPTDPHPTPLP